MARAKKATKAEPVDFAAKAAELKAEKAKAEKKAEPKCCGGDCAKPDTSALADECRGFAASAARSAETGSHSPAAVRLWADALRRAADALS